MSPRIKDLVDVLLKLALIAGIIVFLYFYATGRAVGRYLYIANGELEYVMDTATGVIYQGGYSMNHITGQESSGGKPRK
uniref:Uncharacterized protein n=1 Tax=Desulfovibrio sp. U5L TaxID=596152 RepID=I2PY90_9BACT